MRAEAAIAPLKKLGSSEVVSTLAQSSPAVCPRISASLSWSLLGGAVGSSAFHAAAMVWRRLPRPESRTCDIAPDSCASPS
eukprot:3936791-Rhodomonas_salina.1